MLYNWWFCYLWNMNMNWFRFFCFFTLTSWGRISGYIDTWICSYSWEIYWLWFRIILRRLLRTISISKYFKTNSTLLEIFDQVFGNIHHSMMISKIKHRTSMFSWNYWGLIWLVVKEESVFNKYVSAEIFR